MLRAYAQLFEADARGTRLMSRKGSFNMTMQSLNPATEEVLATFEEFTPAQVDAVLTQARTAFASWRETSFAERATLMRRAAAYLREHQAELGRLITLEMGKIIGEAEAEVEKCAWNCEFYAEHAETFLADEAAPSSATESFVAFEPLGTILAVMPWNFPFWQVLRFAAPALMAGNTAVLKHAANVPQCALAIERIFVESGFPEGVFRTLLIPGSGVAAVIEDPRIAAVTLTGSDITGSQVAATAGGVLKKTVLELGGSDAFIVLADADLDGAAQMAVKSRFQNAGQSCIAAKRFIVVEAVAADFEQRFSAAVAQLRVGDPLDRANQVGPLARGDLREALDRQVRESVAAGARVLVGGKPVTGRGYFYEPTLVTGVRQQMPAFREETFGPLAPVIRVRHDEEAIEVANDSPFGLGGNLWTRDIERGKRLARRLESGGVFINGMTASDPRLPFGGVKRSGYGRELSSYGIREFVNIQTIWIGPARGAVPAPQAPTME
jgi:succinate-semialdehyde dehydrogenase/glutarate-semialdehyde dehydrogenase